MVVWDGGTKTEQHKEIKTDISGMIYKKIYCRSLPRAEYGLCPGTEGSLAGETGRGRENIPGGGGHLQWGGVGEGGDSHNDIPGTHAAG